MSDVKIEPLDAPETQENRMDDVTHLLSEKQRIWIELHAASQDTYRDWVPRWEWILYRNQQPNLDCIESLKVIDSLRTQLKSLEADAAVMRPSARIVELAQRLIASGPKAAHVSCSETHEISEFIFEASETPSGKSLLERLKEAEELLSDWGCVFIGDWCKRRDDFLNPTEQRK